MLSEKIVDMAKSTLERQEEKLATVIDWRFMGARNHETIASVSLIVDGKAFEIWVVLDLDTEEAYCL